MIENTFRSVNIALVNELKMFLTKMDIDIHSALKLANTKPFGLQNLTQAQVSVDTVFQWIHFICIG